jgi:hypothetical protein
MINENYLDLQTVLFENYNKINNNIILLNSI